MTENPSAFPAVCLNDPCHPESRLGMTLRDYFAGQALAAAVEVVARDHRLQGNDNTTLASFAADIAWTVADAMLSARQENRHG